MVRVRATRTIENALRRWGFYRIAGCDEVGRGCLAGPVVAGAVVLDPDAHIPGLADSKMLSADERERLNDVIQKRALAWSVCFVEPAEIDTLNIHRASLQAMRRAVMRDRAAARRRPGGRVSHSRSADRPTRRAAWRSPLCGDRRRLHRRQGVARSADDDRAHERSALRIRSTQGLRHRRTSGRRRAVRILVTASPLIQAAGEPV